MQVIVVFWDGCMLPVHAHVAAQQRTYMELLFGFFAMICHTC